MPHNCTINQRDGNWEDAWLTQEGINQEGIQEETALRQDLPEVRLLPASGSDPRASLIFLLRENEARQPTERKQSAGPPLPENGSQLLALFVAVF